MSTKIDNPSGKLGVLIPGLGAVSTTFIAGVELIRRGLSKPIGSLTQMGTIRLAKRTENRVPCIKDFVPLTGINNLVFVGWDIFDDSVYDSAKNAAVLSDKHIESVKDFLIKIKPMKAVFDTNYVKKLNGTNVKKGKTKFDLAQMLMDDIENFKISNGLNDSVMIWCASTEIYIEKNPFINPSRHSREV